MPALIGRKGNRNNKVKAEGQRPPHHSDRWKRSAAVDAVYLSRCFNLYI